MKIVQIYSLAGLACLALGPCVAQALDWTQYRGSYFNGSSTEKITKHWPDSGLKAVWRTPLTDGFSSFSTGGGNAYTLISRAIENVKRETLVALDLASGKEIWSYSLGVAKFEGGGDSGTSDNNGGDGPRSTPAFVDGKVLVLSANLNLICLEAKTGKVLWTRNLLSEHAGRNISWQNAASPIVDGNLVFVAGGGPGQALLGIDCATGKTVWKTGEDLMTHSTPVVATIGGQRQVIFFTQIGLAALNTTDGNVLWRYKFPYKVSTAASPVVSGDLVYCSAGYGVGAAAVRVTKNGSSWAAEELWRKTGNTICNHWSTPVAVNGFLYGMFSFKEYGDGPMKCVEIATGREVWTQRGFGAGNVSLVDGHLLALSDAGQLVLVKPDPAGYRELARTKAVVGKCWSTPIVSGGRLLVRSTKEGAALDVAPSVSEENQSRSAATSTPSVR